MSAFSRSMRAGVLALVSFMTSLVAPSANEIVADRFPRLTKGTEWQPVARIPIAFRTHHPQGMYKIGNDFFVSSVEITTPTKRYPALQDGHDRDTGTGVGHLFKIDSHGNLLHDLTLGEGSMYHPGGIDYDGRWLWVPVAEYRPNSRSMVYRVDPATMTAVEVFRFSDHIGGLVHNKDERTLHGVSWGSRRLYRWTLDAQFQVTDANLPPERLRTLNKSHYVDYQDCHYLARRQMLCSGLNAYSIGKDGPSFRLGGLELVDLQSNIAIHQIPVPLWTDDGKLPMTQNPFFVEPGDKGLRAYFMPEDDKSTLYVYDAVIP